MGNFRLHEIEDILGKMLGERKLEETKTEVLLMAYIAGMAAVELREIRYKIHKNEEIKENAVYTISDAANVLSFSPETIKNLICDGKMEYIKISLPDHDHDIRILGKHILDFLKTKEVKLKEVKPKKK